MSFQPYSLLSFQKYYVIIWSLSSFSFSIGLLNTILNLSSIDLFLNKIYSVKKKNFLLFMHFFKFHPFPPYSLFPNEISSVNHLYLKSLFSPSLLHPCITTSVDWVWVNSRRLWRTGNPDAVQSWGSQRVEHDLATKQQLNP